jgi:hypothetical protein
VTLTVNIWPPQKNVTNPTAPVTDSPAAVSILGDWAATHTLFSDSVLPPYQVFDGRVQINDSNYVIAERSLAALGIQGSLPFGIPAVVPTQFLLSYAEVYFGGAALAGNPTAAAYQVAVGDSGLSASGIQWGSPNLMDMALAGLMGILSTGLGIAGAAAGLSQFTNLMLEPKAWLTTPSWGSLLPSPVDQAWAPILWNLNRQFGGQTATQLASALALLFELAPDQKLARKLSTNDFAAVFPGVSLSNVQPPDATTGLPPAGGGAGLPDFQDFNPGYIVFPASGASGASGIAAGDYLVTANHFQPHATDPSAEGFRWFIQPTPSVVQAKIGDTGTSVASDGKVLHLYDFKLVDNPLKTPGLDTIGPRPSISDGSDPWVAFAAQSSSMGNGIFAAKVSDPTHWYKIAGESTDGHLDPNEAWVDKNKDGKLDKDEDVSVIQKIDVNGQVGINVNSFGDPIVTFFATTKYKDGTEHYGLQTVAFTPPDPSKPPTPPPPPTGTPDPTKPPELPDPAIANPHILPREDFLGFANVASEGDYIPGAGKILTHGDKPTIDTYDPVNTAGQVVFWANTDKGQVIIRANPPLLTNGQVVIGLENVPLKQNHELTKIAVDNDDGHKGAVVATFVASNPQAVVPDDYAAKIDWGDGTAVTDGTITKIQDVDPLTGKPSGKTLNGVYGVAGNHRYASVGPYIITVFVTDKKDKLGGIGAAYANILTTTDLFSDAAEYVDDTSGADDSTQLKSLANRGAAGLRTFVTVDPVKNTFAVQVLGAGKYSYAFDLSQDSGDSPGDPNVEEQGHEGTVTLGTVSTSGTLDLITFKPETFSVTEYILDTNSGENDKPDDSPTTGPKGVTVVGGASVTTSITASDTLVAHDAKKYNAGSTSISWTHTDKETTVFMQTGVYATDPDLRSTINPLADANTKALALQLTNLALVGTYTITGTLTSTSTISDTGLAKGVKRELLSKQDMTITQTATDGDLVQQQTLHSSTTRRQQDSTINVQTGAYTVTQTSDTTNTILNQQNTNGPLKDVITGSTTLHSTDVRKGAGNVPEGLTLFGGFDSTVSSTQSSHMVTKETNQTAKLTLTLDSTISSTEITNAQDSGKFSMDGSSQTATVSETSDQSNQTVTMHGEKRTTTTDNIKQDGTLFTGKYTVTTTSSADFNNLQTQENQGVFTLVTTTGTSTASQTNTSDNKKGDFTVEKHSTSTFTTTNTSSDSSLRSSITTTASTTASEIKSGNQKKGTWTINAGDASQVARGTTNTFTINGPLTVPVSATGFTRSDSEGTGAIKGGTFTVTETNTAATTSVQYTYNKDLSATATTTMTSLGTSTQTGNSITTAYTLTGTATDSATATSLALDLSQTVSTTSYSKGWTSRLEKGNSKDDFTSVTTSATAAATSFKTTTDRSLSVRASTTESTTAVSTATAHAITGDYSTTASSTQTSSTTETSRNQSLQSTATTYVTSTQSSTETGNNISGSATTSLTSSTTSTDTGVTSNQSLTTSATTTATSSDTSSRKGNTITGDYSVTTTSTATSTQTETTTNQTQSSTATTSTTSTGTTTETGNTIKGAYQTTATSTTTTTAIQTTANQSLSSSATTTSTSTEIDTGSGDHIRGGYSITATTTSTDASSGGNLTSAGSITARSTSTGNDTSTQTSTRTGNSIAGDYTVYTTASATSTSTDTSFDQSQATTATTTSTSASTSTQMGNALKSTHSTTATSTTTSTTQELSTNQSLTVSATTTAVSTQYNTSTGDSVTGKYTTTASATTTSTTSQTTTNQSSSATLTTFATSTQSSTETGNEITGAYSLSATALSTSTDQERSVNVGGGISEVANTTTTSTSQDTDSRSGNSILGDYTLTATTTAGSTTTAITADQSLSATTTSSATSVENSVESGNEVLGSYTATSHSDTTTTVSGASSDQSKGSGTTQTVTAHQDSTDGGNKITGDFTTTVISSSSSTLVQADTNTGQNVTATLASTGGATSTQTGNDISGRYTLSQTSQGTNTKSESGTLGDHSFTAHETDKTTSTSLTTGNQIAGDSTESGTGSDDYSSNQDTTYTDGQDHYQVTRTGTSSDSQTGNDITGLFTVASGSSSQESATGSGNRGNAYTVATSQSVTAASTEHGNSITGDSTLTSTAGTAATETRTVAAAATGSFTLTQITADDSTSTQTGNSISRSYSQVATDTSTVTVHQISSASDGTNNFTLDSTTTSTSTATQQGNSIQGDFKGGSDYASSETLTQSGRDVAGAFTYNSQATDAGHEDSTGNSVRGLTTSTGRGTQNYSFTQDIGGSQPYQLTGTGINNHNESGTEDAISGQATLSTIGNDSYKLTQTGTDSKGSYRVVLTGLENYNQAEAMNSDTGTYSRVTAGTGSASRVETRDTTTTTTVPLSYTVNQSGNYVDGDPTLTLAGTDRYVALGHYTDTSNPGLGSAGEVDFSPIGTPLMVGATPSAPQEYCFAAGTRVLLADGSTRPIEQIRAGDMVLAAPDMGPLKAPAPRRVLRVFHNAPARILTLRIGTDVVRTTYGHAFYTRSRGWTYSCDLRIGDDLRTPSGGWARLTGTVGQGEVEPVYNLEVDGHHTYFVALPSSGSAVLVHNFSQLLVGLAVGAGLGLVGQGLSDLATGKLSSWETYVGSAVAGAVAGDLVASGAVLFIGWAGVGAISAGAGNLVTQGLSIAAGDQKGGFDQSSFWMAVGSGAVGGFVGQLAGGVVNKALGALFEEAAGGAISCTTNKIAWFAANAAGGAFEGAAVDVGMQGLGNIAEHGLDFGAWTWNTNELMGAAAVGAVGRMPGAAQQWLERVCFAAGTPLLTPDGDKAIEEFQVGDRLLSRDENNPDAPVEPKLVERLFVRSSYIMKLYVSGQVIRTTAEHPFWVNGKGWLPARQLKAGDWLRSHDGQWIAVEGLADTGEYQKVYNLQIADFHTYFVGSCRWGFSVWAHNADGYDSNKYPFRMRVQIQRGNETISTRPIMNTSEQGPVTAVQLEAALNNAISAIPGGWQASARGAAAALSKYIRSQVVPTGGTDFMGNPQWGREYLRLQGFQDVRIDIENLAGRNLIRNR